MARLYGRARRLTAKNGDFWPGQLAAEVLGLSFFALLLLQITTVYEELHSEQSKQDDIKNTIVQFMRCHLPANTKADRVRQAGLIGRVVDFLHFKTTTQVRKTPSSRSWAGFSPLSLYPHTNVWANLHRLGQPNTFLAAAVLQDELRPGRPLRQALARAAARGPA